LILGLPVDELQSLSDDQRDRPDARSPLGFVLALWVFSRGLIAIVILLAGATATARSMGVVQGGWHLFTHWDGTFYGEIVRQGYRYSADLKAGVSVAFFPLFPLLAKGLVLLGIPFEVGGPLINNLAFGGAVLLLYRWISDRHSPQVGFWVAAVLVLSPFSLFGTVAYTEGLFLLLTTAALRDYDRQHYGWMALWGALATATRPTGIALIPAVWLAARRERRSPPAYLAGLASAIGILGYSLYCWLQFGAPLAFLRAQHAWRSPSGIAWQGWLKILTQVFLGSVDSRGLLRTPWHPIALGLIAIAALGLWQTRQRWPLAAIDYAACGLCFLAWAVIGDPLINFAMIFGIGWLLWRSRFQLSTIVVTYGFCGLGLILVSGSTISLGRISYGVVAGSIALGLELSRHRHWGYATLGFFALLLVSFSTRYAQLLWAG
jgi:Gpi18-like mannosyltransferase